MQYIADLPPHPSVSVFELKFPTTHASILQAFRTHLDASTAKLQIAQQKIGSGTKLKIVAIIDSIASNPGVYLPWKEMVALCRERDILTVVDAAHSTGQEPNINLSEAAPDFWVSVGALFFPMLYERSELNPHRTVTSGSLLIVHVLSFMRPYGMIRTPEIHPLFVSQHCLETSTSYNPLFRPLTLTYLTRSEKTSKVYLTL